MRQIQDIMRVTQGDSEFGPVHESHVMIGIAFKKALDFHIEAEHIGKIDILLEGYLDGAADIVESVLLELVPEFELLRSRRA
jgi:hypothetical protein